MSENLIPIKSFLGKYYSELNYSAIQEKYKDTKLDTFFEQRFYIQGNKAQMIVDPGLIGLTVIFSGNEVHISKELYDHSSILITNSLENKNQTSNPRSLYNPEVFSTVAYLICQNHTMFQIVGDVDEPIYVKYTADCETFYSSVIVFEIANNIDVEIVEEIESHGALNAVTNYILHSCAKLDLRTFYQNSISATSFVYRNIILQEASSFNHVLFGKGSASIIDENKLQPHNNSTSEFLGVVNSFNKDFHSVLYVQPVAEHYKISVDYRDILYGKSASVTFFPVLMGQDVTDKASITVSNIDLDSISSNQTAATLKKYIGDIIDRAILSRMAGVARFYSNKAKFLLFP